MAKKIRTLVAFFSTLLPLKIFSVEIPCPDFQCYFERQERKRELELIRQREEQEIFRTRQLRLQEEEQRERERQNDLLEEELEELKQQTKLQEESLKMEKELNQTHIEQREKELQRKTQKTENR